MIDPRQLHALAAVIEMRSFEHAARRLNLTQSAVSQRVRRLETHLGQALVIRSTPISATPAGASVLRHYRQMQALHDALLVEVGTAEQGRPARLAVAVNADSLATWLTASIDRLLTNQAIFLDIHVEDQDETHAMLRAGSVVGCISSRSQPLLSCDCVPLGIMSYIAVAAPGFMRRHFSKGVSALTLSTAPAIEFSGKDNLQDLYLGENFGLSACAYPYHQVPSSEAIFQFILRGHGWGVVPRLQASAPLSTRRLVELTPGVTVDIPLYWHVWNITTPVIRTLTRALKAQARSDLAPLPG